MLSSAPPGGEQEAKQLVDRVIQVCGAVHEEDLERNMEMGRLGAEWLWSKRRQANGGEKKGLKVVTVCNTGSLATSVSDGTRSEERVTRGMELVADRGQGYGTAIGVITALFEADQLDTAYYAQTTPYHQGVYRNRLHAVGRADMYRIPPHVSRADHIANPRLHDL